MKNENFIDVIVIGAGQAGLSTSFFLKQHNINHIVFEREKIGSSWSKRWDSFKLNSPDHTNLLPGESHDAALPIHFLEGKQFAQHLTDYAVLFNLPIKEQSFVTRLTQSSDNAFRAEVNVNGEDQIWNAKQVVIASGSEIKPRFPENHRQLPDDIFQIHSGDYRNPQQLPEGAVLIIGSATSGVQIAEDLSHTNREVYISTSAVARLPRRYRGRDIMDWLTDMHFFEKPTAQANDFELNMKAPLMSGVGNMGHTISLQSLGEKGVHLLGYLESVQGYQLTFKSNLTDHIGFGDNFSTQVKQGIDQFIEATQTKASPPEDDPADLPVSQFSFPQISTLDLSEKNIRTVIWATGFTSDFSWIELDLFNENGKPVHQNGFTAVEGLYFMGLPWQRNLKSSLIYGTAGDAKEITDRIAIVHHEKSNLVTI